MPRKLRLFYSYAAQDEPLLLTLREHLAILERTQIESWHPGLVFAGQQPDLEVRRKLDDADIILLLISSSFLAADYLFREMEHVLERHRQHEVRVIPILLRAATLPDALTVLNSLPSNLQPVMSWSNRDEAWQDVALGIRTAINVVSKYMGPEPRYQGDEIRRQSEDLQRLYMLREERCSSKEDTLALDAQILAVRRLLRQGHQLVAGEFLGNGRYRLIRGAGSGGFAKVWEGYDRQERRRVAVKVLHSQWLLDSSRVERFCRGARRMSQLSHQNIVRVIEREGDDSGFRYFVMEYLDGGTLAEAVQRGSLSPAAVVAIVLQIGNALEYAHAQGIVHRDIKPANILLDYQGNAKLTDFDLVWAPDTTGGSTSHTFGSFIYAAPEAMADSNQIDKRSDVYSLGMTTVFALHGGSLTAEAFRNSSAFIDSLDVSTQLKTVLKKASSWNADERFSSIAEFCQVLSAVSLRSGQIQTSAAHVERGAFDKVWLTVGGCSLAASLVAVMWGLPHAQKPEGPLDLGSADVSASTVDMRNSLFSPKEVARPTLRDLGGGPTPRPQRRPAEASLSVRHFLTPDQNTQTQLSQGSAKQGATHGGKTHGDSHGDNAQQKKSEDQLASSQRSAVQDAPDAGVRLGNPEEERHSYSGAGGGGGGGQMKAEPGQRWSRVSYASIALLPDEAMVPAASSKRAPLAPGILLVADGSPFSDGLHLKREFELIGSLALPQSITITKYLNLNLTNFRRMIGLSQPTIFHFSGHGSQRGPVLIGTDNRPCTLGLRGWCQVGASLKLHHVRCAFLNTCFADEIAQLLAEYIEHAVAFVGIVQSEAAIAFARQFYQSLSEGIDLQNAVERGHAAAFRFQRSIAPVLYSNKGRQTHLVGLAPPLSRDFATEPRL